MPDPETNPVDPEWTLYDVPAPSHGGALAAAEAQFGRPIAPWIDLSTGINPWPYQVGAIPAAAWSRLPEAETFAALKHVAATFYDLPADAGLAAAPGSQTLIQMIPALLPRHLAVVRGPTYAEHARCWRLWGHPVHEVTGADDWTAALMDPSVRYASVGNPNNPDGRIVHRSELLAAADRLAARAGLLVVDEAFADVDPSISLAAHAGRPGLVLLRSVGKFFGLAGLRLGFALGPTALTDRLTAALGPWAVSGPALTVALKALADRPWHARTRAELRTAMARLRTLLAGHDLPLSGGTALFQLVEHADAANLHRHLALAGVLTRRFADRPHWLRIGLPAHNDAWHRLDRALANFFARLSDGTGPS